MKFGGARNRISAKFICGLLPVLFVSVTFSNAENQQDESNIDLIAEVFRAEGIDGTLVVASDDGQLFHVHNEKRSNQHFSPASTFKIPNTLIALDTAVVASKDSPFKWDGVERSVPAWNQDQTLQSAFRVSCVWCYQDMARKVGDKQYKTALAAIDYGNQQVGDHVDQFWLNGDLQISANEQIAFLKKLHEYSVPFRRDHVDIVKEIMLVEKTADYSMHAKTGWTGGELHVGWYVGFVEKNDSTWLFAMNMRMDTADQASLRKELTIRSLRVLGIL